MKVNRISPRGNPYMHYCLTLSDRYLLLVAREKQIPDFIDLNKLRTNPPTFPDEIQYLVDRQSGKVKRVILDNANGMQQDEKESSFRKDSALPKGYVQQGCAADVLVEKHANGELKGELAELAATLKEDDNPVLVLVKLKE